MDDLDNDDEYEHRARRLSRRTFDDIENLQSPNAVERVKPSNSVGMNNKDVADHYGDCIRLAAENKITAKNAFQLHLIDYMNDMLNRITSDNFQMASSSLDASAKIYAGRVDAVHQEAYKVLTGLGRSDKKASQTDNQDDENDATQNDHINDINEEDNGEDDPRKKKLKEARDKKRRNIIVKNMNKIRLKSITLQCDVDPLFQQQAAAYDEGGTSELRLNRINVTANSSELILDSGIKIFDRLSEDSDSHMQSKTCSVDMFAQLFNALIISPEMKMSDCFTEIRPAKLAICNQFRKFDFHQITPLNRPDMNSTMISNGHDQTLINIDPIPEEPIEADYSDNEAVEPLDSAAMPGDVDNDDNISEGGRTSVYLGENRSALRTDLIDVQKDYSVVGVNQSGTEFVTGLREMIGEKLDKYGGLTDNMLGMWAGPNLWRNKLKKQSVISHILRKTEPAEGNDNKGDDNLQKDKKSGRRKTVLETLTFGELSKEKRDWSEHFYKSKRACTNLSDQTMIKHTKKKNKLPRGNSDKKDVFWLMTKEVAIISKKVQSSQAEVANINEDLIKCYNYENPLDVNEFCPSQDPAVDFEADIGFDDEDDDLGHPFDGIFTVPEDANRDEEFGGDNLDLVSQPRHIAKIDIDYARVAKRINIRSVKIAMWSCLVPNAIKKRRLSVDNELSQNSSLDMSMFNDSTAEMSETKRFTELLQEIPKHVPRQTSMDLSAPVMVACLLYLSNEKELYLESTEDFNDLIISQSLPQSEIESLQDYARRSARTSADVEEQRRKSLKRTWKRRQTLLDSWLDDDNVNNISQN